MLQSAALIDNCLFFSSLSLLCLCLAYSSANVAFNNMEDVKQLISTQL